MNNEFKYEIWNLPGYITGLESKSKNLADYELEDISGGAMNRKLAASVLAGLSVLTGIPTITKTTVCASASTSISQKEPGKQDINFEITKEQAVEDINYALKIIKDNHVSSVEKVPDEVTNQAKIEIENLDDKVSAVDEWRAISRIFSKLHDAHTRAVSPDFLNKRLPFDTEYECGKFTCTSGDFKGSEITAINDISIQDLYKIFQNHYSYEVDEWTEHSFFETPSDFISEWKLALCGIDTSKPIKVSFNTKSGIQSKNFEMTEIKVPNEDSEPLVSYEIDVKNNLGIFKLNSCLVNLHEYAQTLFKFLTEVSQKKIKNIAIDLRKNVGGDSTVATLFALALKNLSEFKGPAMDIRNGDTLQCRPAHIMNKNDIEQYRVNLLGNDYDKNLLFDGKVFLLTSHRVFSSAILFAELFQDNHLATIVGEIPGNSPAHFGNRVLGKDAQGNIIAIDFETPNSKLTLRTTFKKFYRIDESKDGTKLIPDVEVPAKDALNKVYEIIKK